jgi:hypothetical protein
VDALGVAVVAADFFADQPLDGGAYAYAPWQRGSNEITNDLLLQFMPKGTDLSGLSQIQLNDIDRLLNGRPWQTQGWRTPEQAQQTKPSSSALALNLITEAAQPTHLQAAL